MMLLKPPKTTKNTRITVTVYKIYYSPNWPIYCLLSTLRSITPSSSHHRSRNLAATLSAIHLLGPL